MVDIDEMVRILLERPSKELYYSISEGKFLPKIMREMEDDEDICFFMGAGVCFTAAKRVFKEKYPNLFSKVPSSYSAKKWNEILKENHLEEEWFYEFRLALAEDVTHFTKFYGIHEVEADPSLYQDIKKELLKFEAKHYEKKYSDMVLFHIPTHYEVVSMTVLGNAGTVFGVSFYPADSLEKSYSLIQNRERLGMDAETSNTIMNMVSFYFEDAKSRDYQILNNPFGRDNRFTSCYLTNGSLMNSYLPKSMAILSLHFLREANACMELLTKKDEKKIHHDKFYDVLFFDGPAVFEKDPHSDFTGDLPFDFREISFTEAPLRFAKIPAWDATIRVLPGSVVDSFGEDRCMHFSYTAFFCDHETGYIHINASGEGGDFHPFDEVCQNLMDALRGVDIPKTIYVNNYLDLLFFDNLFASYVDSKKVKIIVKHEQLKTDTAFEALSYFLEQQMEKEDKEKMKSNRS